jgi:hypothetical protein
VTYTGLQQAGGNGGYTTNGISSCGVNDSGTCTVGLACDTTNGNQVGICQKPDRVVVQ